MPDLDENSLSKLAREMVMNIRPYSQVFADFNLTEEDYYEIAKNEYYKRIKDHYTVEWNSTTSTADRVRLQGQAGTEVLMPAVIKRALSPMEPLAAMIEGAKFVAKIGGLGEVRGGGEKSSNERFVITINIGEESKTYSKSIEVNADDIDPGTAPAVNAKPVKATREAKPPVPASSRSPMLPADDARKRGLPLAKSPGPERAMPPDALTDALLGSKIGTAAVPSGAETPSSRLMAKSRAQDPSTRAQEVPESAKRGKTYDETPQGPDVHADRHKALAAPNDPPPVVDDQLDIPEFLRRPRAARPAANIS